MIRLLQMSPLTTRRRPRLLPFVPALTEVAFTMALSAGTRLVAYEIVGAMAPVA
jgi:hypothetical protein